MRAWLLSVVAVVGCKKSEPGPAPRPDALATDHVVLLHTEAVIAQRLGDAGGDALAATLDRVAAMIIEHDRRAPGALPAEVDAVVAVRAGANRIWLVGPDGDVSLPALDAALATIAPIPVRTGDVACVVILARPGTATAHDPYLPSSWTATVEGDHPMDMDGVIAAAWPP